MKLAAMAVITFCVALPPAPGQQSKVNNSRSNIKNNIAISADADGKLKCTTAQGKPCTSDQVQQLATNLNSSKSNVYRVALKGPDGSLSCETKDGKPCTREHLGELNNAAAAMRGANDPIRSEKNRPNN